MAVEALLPALTGYVIVIARGRFVTTNIIGANIK